MTDIEQQNLCGQPLDHSATYYLQYIGETVSEADLWRGLPSQEGGMTLPLLTRALKRVGYSFEQKKIGKLKDLPTPCLAKLGGTDYVLVVEVKTSGVVVVDGAQNCTLKELPKDEFEASFSNECLQFFLRMDALNTKHIGEADKKHWFWGNVFQPRSRFLVVIAASLVANLIAVAVSLFALQVYDRVIPNQNEATLWVLAIGCGIAVVFEFFLKLSRSRLIDETGRATETQINTALFQKLQGMRLDKKPAEPGILVSLIREFQGVREFFGTATVGVAADLPFAFIFLFLVYTIAGPVAWIIAIGAIAMVLPSFFLQRKMVQLSKEMQGGMSASSRLLTEVSYGLENMKTSGLEPWLLRNWEEMTVLNAEKTSVQRTLSAALTFWSASVQQVTYLGAIIGGVYLLFAGEFTAGSIIAVSILTSRTLAPFTQLANILSRWQNMKTSLKALDMVMSSDQDHDDSKTYIRKARLAGDLHLKKAAMRHNGSKKSAVYAEDLKIAPGTKLALLGPNGSGKSSLLRLMSGIYAQSEGSYLIDGLEAQQISRADLRANIGYLPQEVKLFRGTLRENLKVFGKQYLDAQLINALDFAGLGAYVRNHEEGLDLKITDGGGGLSTGQKAAVGMARLFLQDPAIVLMDEPTAALDQGSENALVSKFSQWIGDRTCVIATHRTTFLSQIDRVAVLRDGIVIAVGPKDDILDKLKVAA